jgi:hypothetical protein
MEGTRGPSAQEIILAPLADLQTRRRLPVVGFDQFQECAVRILEAEELGSGFVAEADYHRLGNEINARRLQPLIFLVDILGEQRDAFDPVWYRCG